MYTGLVNFTALFVFGVTGLLATFASHPFQWRRPEPVIHYIPFDPPGGATDKQLADAAYDLVKPPLAGPPPPGAKRNRNHDVEMTFYTPNGNTRVTVLENEKRLAITTHGLNAFQYLSTLHEMTPRNPSPDIRMRLWAWYNEAAIWSLVAMTLSGVYLWLATRPSHRWAQASLAVGTALCAPAGIAFRS
jgi:hypothetical protein